MNPIIAFSVFDAWGNFLGAVVVNNSTTNYVNLAQVLTDNGPNLPVTLGGQAAIKKGTAPVEVIINGATVTLPGLPDSLDFSKPLGTNDTTTQWVQESDLLVNTPAWPDLTKKSGLKFVPLVLIGVLPANAFPTL